MLYVIMFLVMSTRQVCMNNTILDWKNFNYYYYYVLLCIQCTQWFISRSWCYCFNGFGCWTSLFEI